MGAAITRPKTKGLGRGKRERERRRERRRDAEGGEESESRPDKGGMYGIHRAPKVLGV
jgi:hypothetical protein